MFKFWLYIALCLSLIFYSYSTNTNPKLEVLGAGELSIYSRQDVESALIKRRVETGLGFIYYIERRDAEEVRSLFTQIDGESIALGDGVSAQSILAKLGYKIVSTSNDGVMQVTYAYSARDSSFILSGEQKINLQIAERNGIVTVGWPVILGSY